MASTSPPIKLRIVARTAGSLGEATSSWTIDVFLDEKRVVQNALLEDPLKQEQKTFCRWYLEEFTSRSPFSVDLAKDAEYLLGSYAAYLSKQLHLQTIVAQFPQGSTHRTVLIEILDEACIFDKHESTIHQLHWELLEVPATWNDQLDVVVTRSFPESSTVQLSPIQPPSCEPGVVKCMSINILLVVARHTSKNANFYNDVNPSLASGVLIRVQQILKSMSKSKANNLRLNVEVVRPGTFTSFKQHLQRSQDIHGANYYHIVHFDLHGRVGTRIGKASKFGILYFSHPELECTTPIAAHMVARTLSQYKIPYVVLNACESARANCGDDGNIAKVFYTHGVRNVLAMSFKVSSGAAEIFLGSFYHELFIGGMSFTRAAAISRRMLRIHSSRPARFGLTRTHMDWFVPVVYSASCDFILSTPNLVTTETLLETPQTFMDIDESLKNLDKPTITGREFDLLRLETKLLEKGRIYLEGPVGVGKTAFLQYACDIWKSTAFIDVSIIIDFKTMQYGSREELSVSVLRQLFNADAKIYEPRLWTITSLSVNSYDESTVQQIIMNILPSFNTLIILDGSATALRIGHPSSVSDHQVKTQRFEHHSFLNSLLSYFMAPSENKRNYVICSARCSETNWLEMYIGQKQDTPCYELQGLEMVDAIELAERILREAGEDIDCWTHEDFNSLEQVVDLFKGIPASIKEILRGQSILRVPWGQLYERLHAGLVTSRCEYESAFFKSSVMAQELRHLSLQLPRREFTFLLLLGQYWHEAPSPKALVHLSILFAGKDIKPAKQIENYIEYKSQAKRIIRLASDQGYLRMDDDEWISMIHPSFTVQARAWVLLGLGQTGTNGLFKDIGDRERNHWVRSTIEDFLSGTIADRSFFMLKFVELLNTIQLNQLPKWGTRHGWFFSVLLFFCCSSNLGRDQSLKSKILEITSLSCELALRLATCQRRQIHCLAELQLVLFLSSYLLVLSDLDHKEEAEKIRHAVVRYNEQLRHQLSRDETCVHDKPSSLTSSGSDGWLFTTLTKAPQAEYQDSDRSSSDKIHSAIGKLQCILTEMSNCIQNHVRTHSPCANNETLKIMQDRSIKVAQWFSIAEEFFPDSGELERASQYSLLNLDLETLSGYRQRIQMQGTLEDAIDTGNWYEAVVSHGNLITTAAHMFLFSEALEHVAAVEKIIQKSSFISDAPPLVADLKKKIQKQKSAFQIASTLFPSDTGGIQSALDLATSLAESMTDLFPEQTHLALIHYKTLRENDGDTAYPTPISRDRFIYIMRKYGGKAQDPKWFWCLCNCSEAFASLLLEIKAAFEVKDFDLCFKKLDSLEGLVEKEEYLQDLLNDSNFLPKFREALLQQRVLHKLTVDWYLALSNADFDVARAIVDSISKISKVDVGDFITYTERKHWEHAYSALQNATANGNITQSSKLYADMEKRWRGCTFPSVSRQAFYEVKSTYLQAVARQALKENDAKEAMSLCEECLRCTAEEQKEDPRAQDFYINIKEQCEAKQIRRLFDDAEAKLAFEECLRLTDRWWELSMRGMRSLGSSQRR
ncbi:hypothetical protein P152DRAFT_516082 [Eremomyces bilateralis CBS 781.70]|uniref:CHAT domain-containing protein n=1 Tax=Eremomyces bilateralis CBS 781.70 TaxID=1392243 RepID=A0A6G1FX53_9PEZI|nr:uncharacterized protein P152DRAFT_516082 [Eremomyces bilateralis CBS 781.70]KAF1810199.1 hypothetical protein P152DRAFT_516082 [Eremomyces bilateralis CBS 781.70]